VKNILIISQVTVISNGVAASSMEAFMTELSSSGWLKHVKAVLDTSVAVVQNILDGKYPLRLKFLSIRVSYHKQ